VSRSPLDCVIVYGREGLEITTPEEAPSRMAPMKRRHAEAILTKLAADGIEARVVAAFGPGAEQ
jgi:hypothetical protein